MNKKNISIKDTRIRRTFCIGDLHGGYRALIQVLKSSNFDYDNDLLISLGDLADGWSETHLVIEELKKIKNLILIKGNHDEWMMKALSTDYGYKLSIDNPNYDTDMINKYYTSSFFKLNGEGRSWYQHGGLGTEFSYNNNPHLIYEHIKFLDSAKNYYIDEKNRFFAHSGPDPFVKLKDTLPHRFYWNREFWGMVTSKNNEFSHKNFRKHLKNYNEIYIGHTPTTRLKRKGIDSTKPVNIGNVWNLDTGSCFDGRVSMMEMNTKEVFQSDIVRQLYPDEKGRMDISYNESKLRE